MSLITNDTLTLVKNEIEKRNQKLRQFADAYAVSSWDSVQLDVKTLSASDLSIKYPIGTELICNYTVDGNDYDFPWVVLDNNRTCTWEDGSTHQALWLGAKYATVEDIQFDAPEGIEVNLSEEPNAVANWYYWGNTGDTYTKIDVSTGSALPTTYTKVYKCGMNDLNILRYGYNRYSHSAFRQWLNSEADKNAWWGSQHFGDVAPAQLSTRKGFMAGLDPDFLAVIHPVKIQVSTNTITDGGVTDVMYDRFFLQSVEELYGSPQIADIEGPYFPYWKQVTGLANPTNGSSENTNDARKIRRISSPSGSAVGVRCRSAYRGASYYVWYVYSTGYLNYYSGANTSYAGLPACAIS